MKLNIKTNTDWKIIESCISPLEDSFEITVTEEQYEKIQLQYDTVVENWEIISQVKWQNAVDLEKAIEPEIVQ